MAKIKGPGGNDIEGEYVPFQSVIEDWNEYRVGEYIIKTKLVVSDIFRASTLRDAAGNPVFILTNNNVVTVRKVEG